LEGTRAFGLGTHACGVLLLILGLLLVFHVTLELALDLAVDVLQERLLAKVVIKVVAHLAALVPGAAQSPVLGVADPLVPKLVAEVRAVVLLVRVEESVAPLALDV
jgi:hypothetical protein